MELRAACNERGYLALEHRLIPILSVLHLFLFFFRTLPRIPIGKISFLLPRMPAADLTKSDMRGDMSRWCGQHHLFFASVVFSFYATNKFVSTVESCCFFSFYSQDRALLAPQHPLLPPHPLSCHASSTYSPIPQLPSTPLPPCNASSHRQESREAGAVSAPDAGLQRVIATMPDTIVKVQE